MARVEEKQQQQQQDDHQDEMSYLCSFVRWKEPLKTGPVFAAGNFFFYLLTFGGMSLLSIVSYAFLILIGGSFLLTKLRHLSASTSKSRELPAFEEFITEDHAKKFARQANILVHQIRIVLQSEDPVFMGKMAALCAFVAILSKYFSGATILYLAFLGVFIWPIVYERFQTEIDAQFSRLYKIVSEFVDHAQREVKDQIAKHKTKLHHHGDNMKKDEQKKQ